MNKILPLTALLLATAVACSGSKELVCAADQRVCANTCASLQSDAMNCGACGNACGAGQGCSAGACVDCAANPAACTAAVAAACFSTNEVRFLGQDLAQVGPSVAVAAGPWALASAGGAVAVASSLASEVTTITLAPLAARPAIPIPFAGTSGDLEGIASQGGLLFVSNARANTLVVVDPAASRIVTEVPLAAAPGEVANAMGIAFAARKAYVALYDAGSSSAVVVLDVTSPTTPTIVKRIDVGKYATGTAVAGPTGALAANGRIYVTLANVLDKTFNQVPGAHGKLVVIDPATDTVVGDTAVDLGPDCVNATGMAQAGSTLWVACGFPVPSAVDGRGILPVSIAGSAPQPGAIVKTAVAVRALAVCDGRGYAGAADRGAVLSFDVASGTVSSTADACPGASNFVADLACVR